MRTDTFVMRGQTAGAAGTSGTDNQEILNFSGFKAGYAYKLVEFRLYPSTNLGTDHYEIYASITAGKTALDPTVVDFNDNALIANAMTQDNASEVYPASFESVINDTFLITQNLILTVVDTRNGTPVNWQCTFMPVKMAASEETVANYKQFTISDG